jgi:LysM repeat protein
MVQAPSQISVTQAGYQTQAPTPVSYQPKQATYTQVNQECLSKESNRKIIGTVAGGAVGAIAGNKLAGDNKTLGTVAGAAIGGAAGYGIADKTINCDPVSIPAPQSQQTAIIAPAYQPAPTTVYATTTPVPVSPYSSTAATPAIEENTASLGDAGTPGYYAVKSAQDYTIEATPVQVYEAPQPVAHTTSITTQSTGTISHTLVAGDTVYSLARSSCVSVNEFKQINNIDDNYYIRAGDQILIPASRCTE